MLEERVDADLALGRHGHVVGELRTLVGRAPAARRAARHGSPSPCTDPGARPRRCGALADAGRTAARGARPRTQPRAARPRDRPSSATIPRSTRRRSPACGVDDEGGSPFVGRDRELGELLAAHAAAAERRPVRRARGRPGHRQDPPRRASSRRSPRIAGSFAVWARSNELGATPALWPWLDVVRAVIPRVDEVPAVLADAARRRRPAAPRPGRRRASSSGSTPSPPSSSELGRDAPAWSCSTTCSGAIRRRSTCCGSSPPRLQRGVVVVVTVRTLEVGRADDVTDALGAIARRPGSRRLRLGGLALAATGELLDARRRRARERRPCRTRIHDRAEGNPFYTLELARLLDEPGGDDDEVPRDRARRDPAPSRPAARRRRSTCSPSPPSSVATSTSRWSPASPASTLAECLDRLDPAADHRLLVPAPHAPSTLRFSHALVREVLVDGLTPLRRARLHLQVADAIDAVGGGQRRRRAAGRSPVAGRGARRRRAGRRRARAGRRGRRRPRRLHRPPRSCSRRAVQLRRDAPPLAGGAAGPARRPAAACSR